ncbi:tRNA dihydrouridine(20/20a) synthase DusA [Buchnera aphidicola (Periphyllus koelreuteriae)]|uniref:tRNA dihydrouridine(20/20a) synthase DusA n=1 Tax=Buchnera aphidicola TaxID=9 RepID=UPI0031B84B54
MKKKNIICVAPMFKYTDRHCRYFHRLFTKNSFLYTEMTTSQSILNKKFKLYKNKDKEKKVSLQIIGNNPEELAKCADIAYKKKYNEINLNIGCPSIHMTKNNLGVSLMKDTKIIIETLKKIYNSSPIPISIKTRTGFNNNNKYNFLRDFVHETSQNNLCKIFIIHARNAILNKNFTTKKNRTIPKLKYNYVYKLKKDFPHLNFIINGEIKSILEIKNHLKKVDGVMIGREIYKNPFFLKKIEEKIFHSKKIITKKKIISKMYSYIKKEIKKKTSLRSITRHMNGMFYNKKGSKKWKNFLNNINKENNNFKIKKYFKKIYLLRKK